MGVTFRRLATSWITSGVIEPSSSCANISIGINADRIRPGGYEFMSFSKRASSSGEKVIYLFALPVNVAEHEIHAAHRRNAIRDQPVLDHVRQSLKISKARRPHEDAEWL